MSGELVFEIQHPAPGVHLCGVTWDGASLWHSDASTNRLYRLDPLSGEILQELACERVRTDMAYDGEALWQIAGEPKEIRVISPADGRLLETINLGPHADEACGLWVQGDRYWVGLKVVGAIEEWSRDGNQSVKTYSTLPEVDGLALVEGVLWYTSFTPGLLVGLDARTGKQIAQYQIPGNPTGLCWDGTRFWYSDYTNRRLRSIRILPEPEDAPESHAH